jgi:hypothetical protein
MNYCEICEKDVNKYYFDQHIVSKIHMSKLNKEEKVYKCDKCEFTSNLRQTTHKHKKTHEENKEKVYLYHCTVCDKPLANNASVKKHRISTQHNEKLIKDHPEMNLNKDMPMLPFKIDRKAKEKLIIKQRHVVTMKRIVQKSSEKKIEEQPDVFDHRVYLERENESFNVENEELMTVYEKLIKIFTERNMIPSKFLKRAIAANNDYNENILSLQILVQKYANAIEININDN